MTYILVYLLFFLPTITYFFETLFAKIHRNGNIYAGKYLFKPKNQFISQKPKHTNFLGTNIHPLYEKENSVLEFEFYAAIKII